MAKKKPGGNPKNRGVSRVTAASTVPKEVRQALRAYKANGGTLEQLQALEAQLDKRLEGIE